MPQARLTVRLPDDAWIGRVSRAYPDARFRVLSALLEADDAGVVVFEVDAGADLSAVVSAVRDAAAVSDLSVLGRSSGRAVMQVETTTPGLLRVARDAGAPVVLPFEVDDGFVRWTLRSDADNLAALAERLEATGFEFEVASVGPVDDPDDGLTPRQRRVARLAVERGYYDSPRGCDLRDLAAELDVAVSTCSETLRRAEGEILRRYLSTGETVAAEGA
ncbi:helix-turn-helix domain-containing protein [Halorarius halobius]|uniref:helix-turn-helix domain-containing protein n=1 Tax=Halorarius halobius TaxID=2962671 RepID=UPI0020CCED85|nr:helix-turn-helix domain-containing protein [Halorarius halobius]